MRVKAFNSMVEATKRASEVVDTMSAKVETMSKNKHFPDLREVDLEGFDNLFFAIG